MRILFCDDDVQFMTDLQKDVETFFTQIGGSQPEYVCYANGDAVIAGDETADIAFLDVEMPGRSGIRVGAWLKQKNPRAKIIIVTSYPDYLDDAMRFHVFRYLSKPVNKNRLFRNLKDALYQYNMDTRPIPIETETGVEIYPAEDIICVELIKRKSYVYTKTHTIETKKGIDYWIQQLAFPCFYHAYRSFIINMKYVVSFDKDSISLKYGDSIKKAYLARRKYTDFKDTYLLYLESVH